LLDEVDGFLNLNELEFFRNEYGRDEGNGDMRSASDESCEARGSREVAEALKR